MQLFGVYISFLLAAAVLALYNGEQKYAKTDAIEYFIMYFKDVTVIFGLISLIKGVS